MSIQLLDLIQMAIWSPFNRSSPFSQRNTEEKRGEIMYGQLGKSTLEHGMHVKWVQVLIIVHATQTTGQSTTLKLIQIQST